MAAIDKIYLHSYNEFLLFKQWCEKQKPLKDKYGNKIPLTIYLYNPDENCNWDYGVPVYNAPCYVDAYIIRNCPFTFVQKAVRINYGYTEQEEIEDWYNIVKNRSKEDQRIIDEFKSKDHDDHSIPMRSDKNCIPCWWMTLDDFEIVDGKVTYKKLKKSTYEEIREGTCHDYDSPRRENIIGGKHFRITKIPYHNKINRPFKGRWWVEVENTYNRYDFMLFNEKDSNGNGTWDFHDEFVYCGYGWSSSVAQVKTIEALKRKIRKWNLPIGFKVVVIGYFVGENYEFIITK